MRKLARVAVAGIGLSPCAERLSQPALPPSRRERDLPAGGMAGVLESCRSRSVSARGCPASRTCPIDSALCTGGLLQSALTAMKIALQRPKKPAFA